MEGIPSVISTIRLRIHPEHRRRLELIDFEDYSGVARKVAEHFAETDRPLPFGHLEQGIFALKQYYAIALLDPANAHAVSRPLDPFWHAHILHTERYHAFCQAVIGEYMHHRPLDHGRPDHVAAVRTLYDYTLETLGKLFGTVNPAFWPAGVADSELICMHKGNQGIYPDVQPYRLFEPNPRGAAYAN